jgi:hypothetical protein
MLNHGSACGLVGAKEYEGLREAVRKVDGELFMWSFAFGEGELGELLEGAKRARRITVGWAKINYKGVKFGGEGYRVEYLSFRGSGNYHSNCWADQPEKLGVIIKAISESDMKNSLKEFNI